MTKFLEHTAKLVTLVNLLILSTERYRATRLTITLPHKRAKYIAVVMSWLLPMAVSAFNLYFWKSLYVTRLQSSFCILSGNPFVWYTILAVFIVLILLVIVILSILTLRTLSNSRTILANLSNVHRQLRAKRMAGAVRMVLCSLVIYSCCYMPSFSLDLFFAVYSHGLYRHLIFPCINWAALFFTIDFLLIVNSCFSPCVYIVFLKDFREAAKSLLIAKQREEPTTKTSRTKELCITNIDVTHL